ncbi:hypothetical protein D1B33_04695 [Lysinibacillus yapensis]|uniref:Phospholipid phosphatase n=1 Tax=Ureibacillus yapensis TaxID=2304605 RepID=A0A396SM73_9BACL|nr:hypothetical protein [Lysinibacillus yapensis]RHW40147.1 hypothetical protein D1B33_04695 [Lysinibacillus yapensis]
MNTAVYFILGAAYLALLIWGISLSNRNGLWDISNVYLLVIVGLIYDNSIIALGKYIGEGRLLETLSFFRYLLHALFTPALVIFAWNISAKLNLSWAKKTFWKFFMSLLTIALIGFELLASVWNLQLQPMMENGLLTYKIAESGIPLMVIVVSVVLLAAGFIIMKKWRFPWLFWGTLAVFLGSTLQAWIKDFPIMNSLEFILLLSITLTKQFQVRHINTLK